jgi:hypothetical protein
MLADQRRPGRRPGARLLRLTPHAPQASFLQPPFSHFEMRRFVIWVTCLLCSPNEFLCFYDAVWDIVHSNLLICQTNENNLRPTSAAFNDITGRGTSCDAYQWPKNLSVSSWGEMLPTSPSAIGVAIPFKGE